MENFKFKVNSQYKAIIYFKDKNERTFFSRDLDRNNKVNAQIGLARLRKMIYNFGAAVGTAIIYDINADKEIERYPKQVATNTDTVATTGKKSLYKAVVYFHDGNQKSFYSYDIDARTGLIDAKIGLNKLVKMIEKFGDKVKTALMYDNQANQLINIQ